MSNLVVKALSEQILDLCDEAAKVAPGTEAYDDLAKEIKMIAEAMSNVPQTDKTKLIIEIAKTVGVVLAVALVLVFSIDHIVDAKPVAALRTVLGLL